MAKPGLALIIANLLEDAWLVEPDTMRSLLFHRVICRQGLIDHPHILVEEISSYPNSPQAVDIFGVINGILHRLGVPESLVCDRISGRIDIVTGRYPAPAPKEEPAPVLLPITNASRQRQPEAWTQEKPPPAPVEEPRLEEADDELTEDFAGFTC